MQMALLAASLVAFILCMMSWFNVPQLDDSYEQQAEYFPHDGSSNSICFPAVPRGYSKCIVDDS